MRRVTLLVWLVAVSFAVAGCDGIGSGTVAGKEHKPGYTRLIPVLAGKTTVLVPVHEPECWRLDLDDGEGSGSVCVSRQEYDACRTGDRYPTCGRPDAGEVR